jgi:hypothetical protein
VAKPGIRRTGGRLQPCQSATLGNRSSRKYFVQVAQAATRMEFLVQRIMQIARVDTIVCVPIKILLQHPNRLPVFLCQA